MSLTCKDVMLPDQVILHPTDTVIMAFRLMRKIGMRFLPVVADDGTYVGVFTSPTLIKLLLPRAITIHLGGRESNKSLNNLGFYNIDEETFHESLNYVKDEVVMKHLSKPDNIPTVSPDTPIMEGVLLLHQYKRHVILVNPSDNKFIGVLSINAVLRKIFNENHNL